MDDEAFIVTFTTAVFGILGLIEGFFAHKDFCALTDDTPRTCETGIGILTTSLSAYLALGFIFGVVYISFNRFDRWNNKDDKSEEE